MTSSLYYRALAAGLSLALVPMLAFGQSPSTGNTAPWTGGGPPSNPDPTKFPAPPSQPVPPPRPQQPLPQPIPRPRPSRPVVIYPSRPNEVNSFGWYSWDRHNYGYHNHPYSSYHYDSLGNQYRIEYRTSRPYPSRGWNFDGSCWYRYVRVSGGVSFGGYGPDPSVNYYGTSPNVSNGPYTQYVGSDGRTYISVPTTPAAPTPTTYDHALDAVSARRTAQAITELKKHLKEVAADSAASPDLRAERLLAVMYLENSEFSEALSRLALAYRRLPALAGEPLDAADLGIDSARLRELVVKSVRYANRLNTGSSWLMVTILMQAEGRSELALANLAKAEAVGLDKQLAAELRAALAPVQDPPAAANAAPVSATAPAATPAAPSTVPTTEPSERKE